MRKLLIPALVATACFSLASLGAAADDRDHRDGRDDQGRPPQGQRPPQGYRPPPPQAHRPRPPRYGADYRWRSQDECAVLTPHNYAAATSMVGIVAITTSLASTCGTTAAPGNLPGPCRRQS